MTTQTELLCKTLAENGHRITPARQIIIETLVDSGGHITADDLAQRVQAAAPHVGRMSVYRTLELLTELGLTHPIFQGTGAAHYVLMAEGTHHHLICTRCHTVIEFADCSADELIQQLAKQFNFSIQGHLLEVHGICHTCLA